MPALQILTLEGSSTIALPDGQVSIGRNGDNNVIVKDERASRHHCRLKPVDGGYLLEDLGSRNGTQVKGERVQQAMIRFGEAFCIGSTVFRLFPQEVPPVVVEELADTAEVPANDEEVPVAELLPEEAEAESTEAESVVARARRDLNAIRTAGTDPGFGLAAVTLLDCHGKPVHGGKGAKAEQASTAVRTLRLLFFGAFRTRATDIHFDPMGEGSQIRYRVDGKMLPIVLLPPAVGRAVLSVVKILCDLNIAGRNVIQEGSFTVTLPRRVDIRVAMTPTMHGEKLVLRVLDTAGVPGELQQLGLPAAMLNQIRAICHLDAGMMIVSGPTGSGKTTTLYAGLRSIDTRSRNVVTIEDPIEYHLPGITQIQTDAKKGLTFSYILKSVLRQDPDVILVGEIRDRETAQTAMQAAMTGHLVFTTLHARDTIGSVYRLLDLGVEEYMIANSVSICLAQRLVRVLCPHCKRPYRPPPSQVVRMRMESQQLGTLYAEVGCKRCLGVGFWGRMAIFELLTFNDNLRDALMTTKTIHDIRRAAGEFTYQTLLESGYRKVAEGLTTIEEVERVSARE